MRTPRPHAPARGIGTLIGNGWLRESPRNRLPGAFWDLKSKSELRKCMLMAVPQALLSDLPPNAFGAVARPSPASPVMPARPAAEDAPKRRDARRDVRALPAIDPDAMRRVVRENVEAARNAELARLNGGVAVPARAGLDAPVWLGLLLLALPPMGLAVLWSSRRYGGDARWALTIVTALGMCLAAAVAITALALR